MWEKRWKWDSIFNLLNYNHSLHPKHYFTNCRREALVGSFKVFTFIIFLSSGIEPLTKTFGSPWFTAIVMVPEVSFKSFMWRRFPFDFFLEEIPSSVVVPICRRIPKKNKPLGQATLVCKYWNGEIRNKNCTSIFYLNPIQWTSVSRHREGPT